MGNTDFTTSVVGLTGNLRPFAINLTKNIEEANDLVQETVYRALTNEDKFRAGTNLKAWMFTIMKNIFINGYRRKVKRNTIIDTTDNLYYLSGSSNVLAKNKSESRFMMDDITKAIEELNDDYRIPFMMHFKGFKYQEIADDLKLPLGTVKSRIFFARKDLKKKLAIYEDDKNCGSVGEKVKN